MLDHNGLPLGHVRLDGNSFTWHQPCNNLNNGAVCTPLRWIFIFKNILCKESYGHTESHATRPH